MIPIIPWNFDYPKNPRICLAEDEYTHSRNLLPSY